jgi:hypothetical protein
LVFDSYSTRKNIRYDSISSTDSNSIVIVIIDNRSRFHCNVTVSVRAVCAVYLLEPTKSDECPRERAQFFLIFARQRNAYR